MTPKTVVITGATSGIGKATAKALALAGHRVVILARSAERAAKTVTGIEAALQASGNEDLPAVRTIACDLASTASVRRAAGEHPVHAGVCAAAGRRRCYRECR